MLEWELHTCHVTRNEKNRAILRADILYLCISRSKLDFYQILSICPIKDVENDESGLFNIYSHIIAIFFYQM